LAVADLLALPLRRISYRGLLLRCWELRHNLTQYDAAFVALAKLFDATTGGERPVPLHLLWVNPLFSS
jgi:predicted nucleic acid-binding protein